MPGPALRRRLGPVLLTAYGVGVMVGAGIYVLVGAVVGQAGILAPFAFLVAGLVALPSALSLAELSARMPEAAGEAAFVEKGFGSRPLALVVGLALVFAGIISGAAVLKGGVGYLAAILPVGEPFLILALGAAIVAVAAIGVLESLALAAVLTVIEVAGLLAVSWAGLSAPAVVDWTAPAGGGSAALAPAVLLCFFAFIGFENLVNMAEEAHAPSRTIPRAIIAALVVTGLLYALVAVAAARSVPHDALATSTRPLALVWQQATGREAGFLSAVAVIAAINGILAQIIMAARILFGLGRRARWLSAFTRAHDRTGTPLAATAVVGAALIAAALLLPVVALAEATSTLLLVVFMLVNGALIRIKRQASDAPFSVPRLVPWAGLASAAAALVASLGAWA
jgi:amino acid transporter